MNTAWLHLHSQSACVFACDVARMHAYTDESAYIHPHIQMNVHTSIHMYKRICFTYTNEYACIHTNEYTRMRIQTGIYVRSVHVQIGIYLRRRGAPPRHGPHLLLHDVELLPLPPLPAHPLRYVQERVLVRVRHHLHDMAEPGGRRPQRHGRLVRRRLRRLVVQIPEHGHCR